MSTHTERRAQPIYVLGLAPALETVLRDKGIRLVGTVEDKVRDGSILEIDGIGVSRAARLEQAIEEANGPRWKRILFGVVRSNAFTYVAMLGLIVGIMAIGSGKFNSGEVSILLIVATSLAAYELGRWISSRDSDRDTLLTIGRARSVIAIIALMIGFVTQANSLDELPFFGGSITRQGGKVFLLGVALVAWDAIRQFRRATRIRVWLPRSPVPVDDRSLLDRFAKLRPSTQAAIITIVGGIVVAGIGEVSEVIHALKQVSIPLR